MNKIPPLKEEVMDKSGRIYTRRYVQIDKFCDSVVKNIKQPDGEFESKLFNKDILKYHCCILHYLRPLKMMQYNQQL